MLGQQVRKRYSHNSIKQEECDFLIKTLQSLARIAVLDRSPCPPQSEGRSTALQDAWAQGE